MAKSISIKNAETHRLAAQLAQRTGDSIVGAVTKAIKAELKHLKTKDK